MILLDLYVVHTSVELFHWTCYHWGGGAWPCIRGCRLHLPLQVLLSALSSLPSLHKHWAVLLAAETHSCEQLMLTQAATTTTQIIHTIIHTKTDIQRSRERRESMGRPLYIREYNNTTGVDTGLKKGGGGQLMFTSKKGGEGGGSRRGFNFWPNVKKPTSWAKKGVRTLWPPHWIRPWYYNKYRDTHGRYHRMCLRNIWKGGEKT